MAEFCGASHPEQPEVTCTKRATFHANHSAGPSLSWPAPGARQQIVTHNATRPGATNADVRRGVRQLAAGARKPPAEVSRPGAKMHDRPTDTEKAAALSTLPRSGTQRRRVYDALLAASDLETSEDDGLTDEEIQHRLQMNPSTVRPRRGELVEGGFVKDSGQRRKVGSGEWAIVWVIA